MKRPILLLLLLTAYALPATAEVTLDTQGQALLNRLSEAIKADNCDNIIAYGHEFEQRYAAYLDAHPDIKKRTESNVSRCVEAMLAGSQPLVPENVGHGAIPADAPE